MIELLFLLLPLAAYSGWLIGVREKKRSKDKSDTASTDYYAGLNYLLNEKPDQAINAFVNLLQVDSETVEINLALGNLFRQSGEVERAIKLHQNLIARPSLTEQNRSQALLELGIDYMSAGLLDRAEGIFHELLDKQHHHVPSLKQLVLIHERTKDWHQAIALSEKLQAKASFNMDYVIAHFHCELAQEEINDGALKKAQQHLKRALSKDRSSIRAHLMQGKILMQLSSFKQAVKEFKTLGQLDPAYSHLVLNELEQCFLQMNDEKALLSLLAEFIESGAGISVILFYVKHLRLQQGDEVAESFLKEKLKARPSLSGVRALVELHKDRAQLAAKESLQMLIAVIDQLIAAKPKYSCDSCGFDSNILYWQCPACKKWGTGKPIIGIEGE